MKSSLVSLIFTAAASSVVIERQSATSSIANFTAECPPHSVMCYYNFYILSDPSTVATTCGAALISNTQLPNVTDGECNPSSPYSWSITRLSTGDLDLEILFTPSEAASTTSCHTILSSEIAPIDGGASTGQLYVGPANFTASASECS